MWGVEQGTAFGFLFLHLDRVEMKFLVVKQQLWLFAELLGPIEIQWGSSLVIRLFQVIILKEIRWI